MIGRILRLAGPHRPLLFCGIAARSIEALCALVPIGLFYLLLRAALAPDRTVDFGLLLAALAAALVGEAAAHYVAARACYAAGFAMLTDLRVRLARHLRGLPLGLFAARATGDLASVLTRDVKAIEPVPTHLLGALAAALTVPVALLVLLLAIDWRLALATLAGLPLAIVAMRASQHRLKHHMAERTAAAAEASARIVEYGRGIADLRLLGLGGERFPQLEAALRRSRDANLALIRRVGATGFTYVASVELGFPAVLLLAGLLWATGGIAIADLLLFLVATMRLIGPMQKLMEMGAMLRLADAALVRIDAVLAEPLLPEPAAGKLPQDDGIVFRDVSFSYGGRPVLQHVSLTIAPGTVTALVGPSGAGKSTLAHLVPRFWDVASGSIAIGGVDLRDMTTDTLLSRISMVFQTVHLFEGTIADNIRLSQADAPHAAVIVAAKAARCHAMIEALPQGYDTVIGDDGGTLSGGERQRLAIARAMLKDAPIVILDEATASLDPETEREVQEALSALIAGRTVIVIAHRLATVATADQIVVLDGGRVAETGTHAALLARQGLYSRLWGFHAANAAIMPPSGGSAGARS